MTKADNGLIVMLISFLAVCIFVYIVVRIFMHISTNQPKYEDTMYKMIDIFSGIVILVFVGFEYYNNAENVQNGDYFNDKFKQFLDFLNDPYSIVTVFIFLLAVYLTMYFLQLSVDSADSLVVSVIHNGSILLIFMMIIVDFFKYVFQINLIDMFMNYWEPNVSPMTNESQEPLQIESLCNKSNKSSYDVAYYSPKSSLF
jgi:hypothetical protein